MKIINNVIIQAGGSGARLHHHTKNKPKCLVEVGGKTILQRQLELYSGKNIILIADYKINVLKKYVSTFLAKYNVTIVNASANKGTLAGVSQALEYVSPDEPILLVWSDLMFEDRIESHIGEIQIFVTDNFPCRYHLNDMGDIIKETSSTNGIIGAFTFKNKNLLKDINNDGSLVGEWMRENKRKYDFIRTNISNVKEVGDLQTINQLNSKPTSRFFNLIKIHNNLVEKTCVEDSYCHLLEDEKNWYKHVLKLGFSQIPKIKSYEPFIMQHIKGKHAHDNSWTKSEKKVILENVCFTINQLHSLKTIKANDEHIENMYLNKTLNRIEPIKNLIPFYEREEIIVNGVICKNPFSKNEYQKFVKKIKELNVKNFCVIHGDPTFNNFLVEKDKNIILYDPRGSFCETKVYGDPNYDWAKLYYSIVGNYDSVNDKKFNINYNINKISFDIQSNGWEFLEEYFFELSKSPSERVTLISCLIWFSLCGYVRDYDSILVSYAKGLELWQKIS